VTAGPGESREERISGILDHLVDAKRRHERDPGHDASRQALDRWRQELERAVGRADPGYTERRSRM
jgi:hypothetical protein